MKPTIIYQRPRPNRELTYMMMAMVTSLRGTCLRANVGAVVVKDKRVICIGYNGSLPGGGHCNSDTCTPDAPCSNTVHAEANAVYFAAKHGLSLEGSTLYCTHSPCIKCTEAIIQSGIKEVVFLNEYRETDFDLFRETKIRKIDAPTQMQSYFFHLGATGINSVL